MTNRLTVAPRLALGAVLLAAGCGPGAAKAPPPAAEKPKSESDLAHTTLSADAAKSLKIRVEPARRREVQGHVARTGWVMARQGNEVTVTAPVAGYVLDPAAGRCPAAGTAVTKGQELARLKPVLSPVEEI